MLNSDPYKTRGPGPYQQEASNQWTPILELSLSIVGSTIDLKDRHRLYSGVTVSGIRYDHELRDISDWGGQVISKIERVSEFTIVTTTADIRITPEAEWRHHG